MGIHAITPFLANKYDVLVCQSLWPIKKRKPLTELQNSFGDRDNPVSMLLQGCQNVLATSDIAAYLHSFSSYNFEVKRENVCVNIEFVRVK